MSPRAAPTGVRKHDVVIVGAGPAGCATATLLARAGMDVLLVDRATFPRRKACGECLSPGATRLLDALGVLAAVEARDPARLEGWRIVAPGGHAFEASFATVARDPAEATALAIGRDRLDAVLLEAARRAGAETREGTRIENLAEGTPGVTGRDPAGPFEARARLVVGADGLRSAIARRMGAPSRPPRLRKLSLSAHCIGVQPDRRSFGEMHLGDGMCAGVAPIDGGMRVHNVTLVVDADRFGRDVAADPVSFFFRTLASFPRLGARTGGAAFAQGPDRTGTGPLLASGPFDRPTRRIVSPGYALVGDAAGYYDPFTGQGIFQALAGGRILADEALPALQRPAGELLLLSYQKRLRRLVRGARGLQRIIETVIRRPALADRAIARLARRPATGRALLAATGDLGSAFDALSPAVLLGFLSPGNREATRS